MGSLALELKTLIHIAYSDNIKLETKNVDYFITLETQWFGFLNLLRLNGMLQCCTFHLIVFCTEVNTCPT